MDKGDTLQIFLEGQLNYFITVDVFWSCFTFTGPSSPLDQADLFNMFYV